MDREFDFFIRPALLPSCTRGTAAASEKTLEDVAEPASVLEAGKIKSAISASPEPASHPIGRSKLIVALFFLRIPEHLICFIHFFEFSLGFFLPFVFIRMELFAECSVRFFDVLRRGTF